MTMLRLAKLKVSAQPEWVWTVEGSTPLQVSERNKICRHVFRVVCEVHIVKGWQAFEFARMGKGYTTSNAVNPNRVRKDFDFVKKVKMFDN